MRKAAFFFLAIILCAVACSLFRPQLEPYPDGVVFPLAEEFRLTFEGKILGPVLKSGARLFMATDKGVVYCIDGAERRVLWTFICDNEISGSLAIGGENIYFIDSQNTLYCLSGKGVLLWQKKLADRVTTGVAERQGLVYLGTEKGDVLALKEKDGEPAWVFQAAVSLRTGFSFWGETALVGDDGGEFYLLDRMGRLLGEIGTRMTLQGPISVSGDRLYFGLDQHFISCLDLIKRKLRWKVKIGGYILHSPLFDGKRIFLVASNSVLFCLDKNGDILWWNVIPTRIPFALEKAGTKILVSSLSSTLLCFDAETGKESGRYEAEGELRSKALWLDPYVLISPHDYQKGRAALVYLKKDVRVSITASLSPPQKVGEEVNFTAEAVAFHRPKYEFYLQVGEKKEVVQSASEKRSWTWFPDKEGIYVVSVRVSDEKEIKEAEVRFEIVK